VDENKLTERLRFLGVTLLWDADPVDRRPDLVAQRLLRTSLYLQHLEDTKAFFRSLDNPDADGLGKDYAFVKPALESGDLLTSLAKMLDRYACPAVAFALKRHESLSYEQYFQQQILYAKDETYETKRNTFLNTYPIARDALQTIATNFQRNLRLACKRVIADRDAITLLYQDTYRELTLHSLTRINPSGSDFHKGGQQVLILTFSANNARRPIPELQIVYKPSDVEVDCLVVGNSVAVNRALETEFMKESLTEIFNSLTSAQPDKGRFEPLPTYRILPRKYMSQQAAPVPLREAYGYIEYLKYELTGTKRSFFNYYPFGAGASDYTIFRRQDATPIIRRLYRQMGDWMAIACTFSLIDLHIENVRIMGYQAYLIDLETSLSTRIDDLRDTGLLDTSPTSVGGINGGQWEDEEDYVWFWNPQQREMHKVRNKKYGQNRLWHYKPNLSLVPVDWRSLLEGLRTGLHALASGAASERFETWFERVKGVLVRVLPFGTMEWLKIREEIYLYRDLKQAQYELDRVTAAVLLKRLTKEYNNYSEYKKNMGPPAAWPEPAFVVMQESVAGSDLRNLDIPTFYHRIGTTDLLDSRGNVVPIPNQVMIEDQQGTKDVPTDLKRATYFEHPPTDAFVRPQLSALTESGAEKSVERRLAKLIRDDLRDELGHGRPVTLGH
jgi:hypothetical protein